jgi:hypothetical protein
MDDVDARTWADTSCLLCGAPAATGHHPGCPGADPDAVSYLDEHLPDGTIRSWTMAGARYTAPPARRAAITALMPTMDWYPAAGTTSLPFTIGALLTELVPKLGVGRHLSRFGFHPLATILGLVSGCQPAIAVVGGSLTGPVAALLSIAGSSGPT